jgi:hypothetical protein
MRQLLVLGSLFVGASVSIAAEPQEADWSGASMSISSGPCPPEEPGGCVAIWRVTVEGKISVYAKGHTEVRRLSEQDLHAVRAVVSDAKFRRNLKAGFGCNVQPTDRAVGFDLELRGGAVLSLEGPACLDEASPLGKLLDVFRKYN